MTSEQTTPQPTFTRRTGPGMKQTAEQKMPWIIYTYGRTHDGWWPVWNSTRVTGRAKIGIDCCVCGDRTVLKLKIPRFGPVNPCNRYHPARSRYLLEHMHPDRGHPISWARPLTNLNVFGPEGMDLDLFAARLEADLNAAPAPSDRRTESSYGGPDE